MESLRHNKQSGSFSPKIQAYTKMFSRKHIQNQWNIFSPFPQSPKKNTSSGHTDPQEGNYKLSATTFLFLINFWKPSVFCEHHVETAA